MVQWILNKAKTSTEKFFVPLMKVIALSRLPPAFFTALSFICGIGAVLNVQERELFFLFAALSLIFDVVDGHLARFLKKESKVGMWLDYGSDRMIEGLLILVTPIDYLLVLITLSTFLVHQLLFIFVKRTLFFGRMLLMVFFFLGLFKIGIILCLIGYVLGILWQCNKVRKRPSRTIDF
ncbi:MAG: CDP-alcohol phosphatidyltransferase family protein [Candidatus Nanoarchaeia archaeon]